MVTEELKRITEVLTGTFTIGKWEQPLRMRKNEKTSMGKAKTKKSRQVKETIMFRSYLWHILSFHLF